MWGWTSHCKQSLRRFEIRVPYWSSDRRFRLWPPMPLGRHVATKQIAMHAFSVAENIKSNTTREPRTLSGAHDGYGRKMCCGAYSSPPKKTKNDLCTTTRSEPAEVEGGRLGPAESPERQSFGEPAHAGPRRLACRRAPAPPAQSSCGRRVLAAPSLKIQAGGQPPTHLQIRIVCGHKLQPHPDETEPRHVESGMPWGDSTIIPLRLWGIAPPSRPNSPPVTRTRTKIGQVRPNLFRSLPLWRACPLQMRCWRLHILVAGLAVGFMFLCHIICVWVLAERIAEQNMGIPDIPGIPKTS